MEDSLEDNKAEVLRLMVLKGGLIMIGNKVEKGDRVNKMEEDILAIIEGEIIKRIITTMMVTEHNVLEIITTTEMTHLRTGVDSTAIVKDSIIMVMEMGSEKRTDTTMTKTIMKMKIWEEGTIDSLIVDKEKKITEMSKKNKESPQTHPKVFQCKNRKRNQPQDRSQTQANHRMD